MLQEDLKGKSIAILALGGSFADFVMARMNSKPFDEIWGINCIGGIFHVDRTFMMDPASRFLDTDDAGGQTNSMAKVLKQHQGPIYTCELDDRCPGLVEYPINEVLKEWGCHYLNNTVAYAIAFALYNKVGHLQIFGVDFGYKGNLYFAEAGRACCEFWLAIATTKGIKIHIAHNSSLLDTNVSDDQKLYGYHRLEDPLVSTTTQGEMLITKKSKLEPPEPLDAVQNIIGREDIPGVTYEEEEK